MDISESSKIRNLLSKLSKDAFYHEYIELNHDKKDLVLKYNLNSFEWKYFTKDCGMTKPISLSRAKSGQRGGITRLNKNDSCRAFVQNNSEKIQAMMNEGKSILEIFDQYQELNKPSWHDYSTFGVYIRKLGLKYSQEASYKVAQTRAKHFSQTMISKSPAAKYQTYLKYKFSMNSKSDAELRTIRLKIQNTKNHYSSKRKEEIQIKANKTKAINKSFNISKSEKFITTFLKNMYKAIDQYRDFRYPFNCDIYIPEFDLFIELNSFWTHGDHPFDKNNPTDLERLEWLRSKQKYRKSKTGFLKKNSYYAAEDTWTIKDPLKLEIAKKNHLNYLMIYNLNSINMYEITKWNFKRFHGINILDMHNIACLNTEI